MEEKKVYIVFDYISGACYVFDDFKLAKRFEIWERETFDYVFDDSDIELKEYPIFTTIEKAKECSKDMDYK